jgi:hypothetical protein
MINLRSSPDDDRDYIFECPEGKAESDVVDQRPYFPNVQNQWDTKICTAETITTLCESILNMHQEYTPGVSELSRSFNYYWSRQYDGKISDSGAYPRSVFKAARLYGLPKETTWPFDPAKLNEEPSREALLEGVEATVTSYFRIPHDPANVWETIRKIEWALAQGYRVGLAYKMREWMKHVHGPLYSDTHRQPIPDTPDVMRLDGSHMVPLTGYDRQGVSYNSVFIAQNSWGTAWGDNGYWSIPYSLFGDSSFVLEIWVVGGFRGIQLPSVPTVPPRRLSPLNEERDSGPIVFVVLALILFAILIGLT